LSDFLLNISEQYVLEMCFFNHELSDLLKCVDHANLGTASNDPSARNPASLQPGIRQLKFVTTSKTCPNRKLNFSITATAERRTVPEYRLSELRSVSLAAAFRSTRPP